jgi:hypothetical protein
MAEYLPAPSFNLTYNVPPMNIGAGYAAGISQAGQAASQAIGNVADIMSRNRTVDDTLAAMNQNQILSD